MPILPCQEVLTAICDECRELFRRHSVTDTALIQFVLEQHRLDVNAFADLFVGCVSEMLTTAS